MGSLDLRLLGTPEVGHDGRLVLFPTRKTLALLTVLAVREGMPTREQLGTLFWPTSDLPHSQASLRRTLVHLRRALQDQGQSHESVHLLAQQNRLGIHLGGGGQVDLAAFRAAASVARSLLPDSNALTRNVAIEQLTGAIDLYRGDFLDDFSLEDAPEFDAWVSVEREVWATQLDRIADCLTRLLADGGQASDAIGVATRWVRHRRLNETAHARLMSLHLAAGDRAAALAAYEACRAELAHELDIAPGPEIEDFARRLRALPLQRLERARDAAAGSPVSRLEVPFVGRATEFEHLLALYRQVGTGCCRIVSVEGESGIGKTRLMREAARRLAADGADIVEGRAFETSAGLPYQPLVDALRARLERENAPDDLISDVWLAELSRLLPELRERYPDLRVPTRDDAAARMRLFEAVSRLGQVLARSCPVVIVIDDLQWADAGSLDLIAYCTRRWTAEATRILVLVGLRSEVLATTPPLAEWIGGIERDVELTRLELGRLSAMDTERIVWGLGVARWLYGETGGQPLFVVETVKALLERGILVLRLGAEGRWKLEATAASLDAVSLRSFIPTGIRRVIQARLARLAAGAASLLAAAAILGRDFTFAQAQKIAGLDEDTALPALDQLLASRLLDRAAQSPARREARFAFAHDRIRDVVYTEAGEARRQVLHRRAFDALQSMAAPAAELAYHAEAGGMTAEAIRYGVAAGREALRLFAVRDAIGYLERAHTLLAEEPPDITLGGAGPFALPAEVLRDLYALLGRARDLSSDFAAATATYDEMRRRGRALGDSRMECLALNRLATLAGHDLRAYPRIMALLAEARGIAEVAGDSLGLAETEWNFAHFGFYFRQLADARVHGERALVLAREAHEQELVARCLNVLAYLAIGQVRLDEAARLADEAFILYGALGERAVQVECQCQRSNVWIKLGRTAEGIADAREAVASSRAIENPFMLALSLSHLAMGLADFGAYAEAREVADEGVSVARSLGIPSLFIFNLLVLGSIHRLSLALDAARATHDEARQVNEQRTGSHFTEPIASELCADCVLAGDWAAAAEFARAALTRHQDTMDLALFVDLAYWCETAALARSGDGAAARADTDRFGRIVGHSPRLRIPFLRSLAVLAAQDGNLAGAIAHLEQALELASALDLPGEAWPIGAELGTLWRAAGDEARARAAHNRAAGFLAVVGNRIGAESLRQEFLASPLVSSALSASA